MRSSIILFLAFLFSYQVVELNAQSLDQSKMDKDLEVSKNVLSSLMEGSTNNRFMWRSGDNIDAKYLSGYGLVYSIYDNFPMLVEYGVSVNEPFVVSRSNVSIAKVSRSTDNVNAGENPDTNEKLKEIGRDFIMSYHNLVRQLKPSDKIMVKTRTPRERRGVAIFGVSGQSKDTKLFSLEAKVSDLTDYSNGKISKDVMLSRIEEKDITSGGSLEPEIEIFSAAFGRMYQSDLASSYYMTGYPWYERTENYGVTYYLSYYSSTIVNDLYNLPTFNKFNLELIERNELVESAYPEFKESLKENMLDYGHLLKNLKDPEFLVFNVKLTECKGCSIPKVIELKVKKAVIDQYRNGSLTLQAAKKQIEENILES